ncbi:isoprenyl transferase [Salisediminibacterium halotolerans]|uniref:isoprenyl transferase n=1 Tax=Salisediminibacterium halotolerans TaxID=517425 RepID=UPI000EB0B1D4|nr:isoprenyl transferase [Salisediminibacterium halotolerans]RLJ74187.1 undecaprenyl pyrophosphate synthetase [Actinophytocola xinjiangensis]RPE87720.1 undecaprenyl pyrophosphate synthetase [Salisediminibacterium halotolerans]TWG35024.1 undecaprenyl pyrophosphate synthetase [Salisediminibacterium halotolerans]GEL06689.1 isoprenyl transferase [Salisediminibacterium halotolerans]
MLNKLMGKEKPAEEDELNEIEPEEENIPKHIAVIMDGNGRWAKKRGLPRVAGHREGMNAIRRMVRLADRTGVEVLTLYAFSTENWKRPKTEVEFLMRLPERFLNAELPELIEKNVRVRVTGEIETLPEYTQRAVKKAAEETSGNTGMILNFALNYGSRSEIIESVKTIYKKVESGEVAFTEIDEGLLSKHLMTAELRDPDLLIRTSGEIRLSNFMLWQLAYAEFWFTDVLWPDFDEKDFNEAVRVYQQRQRRYGGV